MAPRNSIALMLAAISLASAQSLPHPTRLLTNPVQHPGFSDDPALTTPRPLVIITPPEVIYGDAGSTSDNTLPPETTVPYQAEVPVETTTTTTPAVPSTPSLPSATSTSSSTIATATTEDAKPQVASTSIDTSPIPFIGPRFVKQAAASSMANPASMPIAFTSAAAGLIAIVGLVMAL
ncbi:hypothetical protein ACQKWADRAFT_325068 [Trichoderma austrokoningii]